MPLGNLGSCSGDVLRSEASIRSYTRDYCSIINGRPRSFVLPPYVQPPKNSVRWQPRGSLTIPVAPAAVDQQVFGERVPLGYDGILIAVSNIWNGTGFVEAGGDITWRVKIDRRFIPFFDTIATTLGSLAVPFDIVGQGIPLLSGQLVQYFVNFGLGSENRLNVGGKTICGCTGYIWPRERLVIDGKFF